LDQGDWARVRALEESCARVEHLPFTVRLVRTDQDLKKAIAVRHLAYSRHLPTVAEALAAPEPEDVDPECPVLVAESKLDGSPLGTVRIHTSRSGPLPMEKSVRLPVPLANACRAEATRLGVAHGASGLVVRYILFKACFQYCLAAGIEWIVIAARAPLDKMYRAWLFKDVFEDAGFRPMAHAGNLPHRVLGIEVGTAREEGERCRHPLYGFMFETQHPDIQLGPPPRLSIPSGALQALGARR
jgi:hypothetical protein